MGQKWFSVELFFWECAIFTKYKVKREELHWRLIFKRGLYIAQYIVHRFKRHRILSVTSLNIEKNDKRIQHFCVWKQQLWTKTNLRKTTVYPPTTAPYTRMYINNAKGQTKKKWLYKPRVPFFSSTSDVNSSYCFPDSRFLVLACFILLLCNALGGRVSGVSSIARGYGKDEALTYIMKVILAI